MNKLKQIENPKRQNQTLGEIPEGWETRTVHDLMCEHVLDKPLDGNHGNIHPKSSDYVEKGIPFIMASDIVNGRVDTTHCKFLRREQADRPGQVGCPKIMVIDPEENIRVRYEKLFYFREQNWFCKKTFSEAIQEGILDQVFREL